MICTIQQQWKTKQSIKCTRNVFKCLFLEIEKN